MCCLSHLLRLGMQRTVLSRRHVRSVLDVQPDWAISSAAHRMPHKPTTPTLYWQSHAQNWTFIRSTKYCVSTMLHRKVLQLTELRHDNVLHAVESATLLLHTACRSRQMITSGLKAFHTRLIIAVHSQQIAGCGSLNLLESWRLASCTTNMLLGFQKSITL